MNEERTGFIGATLGQQLSRREALGRVAGAGAVAALATVGLGAGARAVSSTSTGLKKGTRMAQEASPVANAAPTVVLVHGAFADGSSWNGVIGSLKKSGIAVLAPANPLRGIASDSAYIDSVVAGIPGPVLLVGHSYGGIVITNSTAANAIGLVYIAAFTPDDAEILGALLTTFAPTPLQPALRPASVPATEADLELLIDPAAYHDVFAADLPLELTEVLAVSQRPIAASVFAEASGASAWKRLPSWALVATGDQAIGAEAERFFAERAGSITIEVDASHAVAVSQPEAVADLIRTALESLA